MSGEEEGRGGGGEEADQKSGGREEGEDPRSSTDGERHGHAVQHSGSGRSLYDDSMCIQIGSHSVRLPSSNDVTRPNPQGDERDQAAAVMPSEDQEHGQQEAEAKDEQEMVPQEENMHEDTDQARDSHESILTDMVESLVNDGLELVEALPPNLFKDVASVSLSAC
eukprot:462345-Hanusia_phi.AAC.2